MAKPISELILLDILDALATVQRSVGAEGDAVAGHGDYPQVQTEDKHVRVAMGKSEEISADENRVPMLHDGYVQGYEITLDAVAADDDIVSRERYLDRLEKDVLEALKRDYTRGGYAQNQFFRPSEAATINEASLGRTFTLDVEYLTLQDNPHEQ